jgi:hypothetical protein
VKNCWAAVTSWLFEHDALTEELIQVLTLSTTPRLLQTHGAYKLAAVGHCEPICNTPVNSKFLHHIHKGRTMGWNAAQKRTSPITAYDRPACAHDGSTSSCDKSVMYALTIFFEGVENVILLSWLQYLSMMRDALHRSSVAFKPQL